MISVAPLVGAWIEILWLLYSLCLSSSLPSWERGLKSECSRLRHVLRNVAPLVGAWIEILMILVFGIGFIVAPLVGAWIEMDW